jgi:hypothetical protein
MLRRLFGKKGKKRAASMEEEQDDEEDFDRNLESRSDGSDDGQQAEDGRWTA